MTLFYLKCLYQTSKDVSKWIGLEVLPPWIIIINVIIIYYIKFVIIKSMGALIHPIWSLSAYTTVGYYSMVAAKETSWAIFTINLKLFLQLTKLGRSQKSAVVDPKKFERALATWNRTIKCSDPKTVPLTHLYFKTSNLDMVCLHVRVNMITSLFINHLGSLSNIVAFLWQDESM